MVLFKQSGQESRLYSGDKLPLTESHSSTDCDCPGHTCWLQNVAKPQLPTCKIEILGGLNETVHRKGLAQCQALVKAP